MLRFSCYCFNRHFHSHCIFMIVSYQLVYRLSFLPVTGCLQLQGHQICDLFQTFIRPICDHSRSLLRVFVIFLHQNKLSFHATGVRPNPPTTSHKWISLLNLSWEWRPFLEAVLHGESKRCDKSCSFASPVNPNMWRQVKDLRPI